jgi:hypothetical protein
MPFACACADLADRSEKGAMPPGVWQPAHFWAKIGATSFQVGAATLLVELVPLEPAAIATTTTAMATTAPSASPILPRLTLKRYRQRSDW